MADKTAKKNNDALIESGIEMPFSIEAEQAVIGSVLIDPECISKVLTILKPEYFYIPQHRAIIDIFLKLFTLGSKIDPLIILEELRQSNVFDEESGKNYLIQLGQAVPHSSNVENYCNIVKDKFYLRTVIEISHSTISDATSPNADAEHILDAAEQRIYDIRKGKTSNMPKLLSEVINNEVYITLQKITSENSDEFKGIPTGFSRLDEMISGLNRSDLIFIGARPAMGKTSFALNIARNVSMKGKKVVFFSLEMSNEQLASRVLSTEARVESSKFRSGNISNEEWIRLAEATSLLSKCQLYFDDTSTITVPEMKSKIRRMKDVDCIIIDYLQLMKSATVSANENRVAQVTDITRSLKLLAKDLKIPVVVCCQLSRGPEKGDKSGKKSNRPMLSDLRESGSIEQDADIVLMLYREGYYAKDKSNPEEVDMTKADLDIAKNRHGPTDRVKLHWDAQFTLFSTLEYRDE